MGSTNRVAFEDVEHGTTSLGTYDAQDRMLAYGGSTYTYTDDGAMRTKTDSSTGEVTTYTYDALGNLTHVDLPDGRAIDYVVDGAGRRVGKKVNGGLTQGWLYRDGLRPVAELNGTGAVVSRFVWAAGKLLYMVKGGTTYRIITDQLGSPRVVTDSTSGTVAERRDFDEWGNTTLDTNPGLLPFALAAGLFDPDTGLIRFGARDYDSQSGQWLAEDPIRFLGGQNNLHAYANEDPVNHADRGGLATYICQRPIGVTNPGPGDQGPPLFHHTFVCVVQGGNVICGGQAGAGGSSSDGGSPDDLILSPGMATVEPDTLREDLCKEVHGDNACMESCVGTELESGLRPTYGIGPQGTDCGEYADDLVAECAKLCGIHG